MPETTSASVPPDRTPDGRHGPVSPEESDWGLGVLTDPDGWSPGATGTVWWNAATATVEIWAHGGCIPAEVADNTPEGVARLLSEMGWELGSGWAFASDSDTVRYAAVDPFDDDPAGAPR